MAMALSGQTPSTLNAWLGKNGGYHDGNNFVFTSVEAFGLKYLGSLKDLNEIRKAKSDGHLVILHVDGGTHFVLCSGLDGNRFLVRDPFYPKTYYEEKEVVNAVHYLINKGDSFL